MFRKGIAIALILASLVLPTPWVHAEESVGYVTSTGLYIRKAPSTTADALRCAANGEKLIILRTEGDWYYVKYNNVVSGYVAKRYVSKTQPSTGSASSGSSSSGSSSSSSSSGSGSSSTSGSTSPTSIAEIGKAPATTRRGDRGNDVKKLQQALKIYGYYSGSADGIFGQQTETAVKGFQKAKGLSSDGIAGKVTIKTLFGEDAAGITTGSTGSTGSSGSSSSSSSTASGNVEYLDWFTEGKNLMPRGASFVIKDVRTGTRINCKHLYGGNHLDAEPLTAGDTAKLLEVYGGEWSWNRRPVIISYNGRLIAASMNGMPHGEQSITDNNFDGQFCIHLTGSKTHGSSKVDADHQAAIQEAAKASW